MTTQPTATPTATPRPTPTATPRPAATPTPTPRAAAERYGGEFREVIQDFPHFDAAQSQIWDIEVTGNTNNWLVKQDETDARSLVGDLAASWAISDDARTVTFTLRDEVAQGRVKFHDGETLNCDDIEYTFKRILDPPTGMVSNRQAQLLAVESAQCTGPSTFVFNLNSPSPDVLVNIADPFNIVFPKHVAEPNDRAGTFMKQDIIGSGPFKLKRKVVSEIVELERNTDYWKEGLPYLDKQTYFILEPTYSLWVAGFLADRFDYTHAFEAPQLIDQVNMEEGPRLFALDFPTTLYVRFIPQMKPGSGSVWEDKEVRRAAALALIQDEFIEVMCPIAFACSFGGPLHPSMKYGLALEEIEKISAYGKNAEARRNEARLILARKGLVGYDFTIHTWNLIPAFNDSAIVVCDLLQKVGFSCRVDAKEAGAYYGMVNNQRVPVGDAVVHSIGQPSNTVDTIMSTSVHPEGVRNYGSFEDQRLRDFFDAQTKELDETARRQILFDYQKYAMEQYYHTWLSWRGFGRIMNMQFRGEGVAAIPGYTIWPVSRERVWKAATPCGPVVQVPEGATLCKE